MFHGACNCGSVAFEIESDVKDIYICHCSICRKWTGNTGVAVVMVPNKDFHWVSGEEQVSTWRKPESDWHSSFCAQCGSALPGKNDEERMFVPAGLLDDPDRKLCVAAHIWVGSKTSWDVIGDDGHQYQRAYGDE